MIRAVATDIDGTITVDRRSTVIDTRVIEAMRRLEGHGVYVILVSANALPVVVGLKRYFGLRSPCIGESGTLVYTGGSDIIHLTMYSCREAARYVEENYSDCLYPSWQNHFRLHDYAFRVRDECRSRVWEIVDRLRRDIAGRYGFVKVNFSGYAIHLTPIDASKSLALRKVVGMLGLSMDEVAAIGDSVMDMDMIVEAGLGVAVANADEELRRAADYVTSRPSGEGFIELAEKIIRGEL